MWPFRSGRSSSDGLGRRGEKLAARLLKQKGLKILARNYRCPIGEVDLIALDPATQRQIGAETLVIVEVKTRSSEAYVVPESAVNAAKRRRLRNVAAHYLAHRAAEGYHVRFDVVSIVLTDAAPPQVRHIPDAF